MGEKSGSSVPPKSNAASSLYGETSELMMLFATFNPSLDPDKACASWNQTFFVSQNKRATWQWISATPVENCGARSLTVNLFVFRGPSSMSRVLGDRRKLFAALNRRELRWNVDGD